MLSIKNLGGLANTLPPAGLVYRAKTIKTAADMGIVIVTSPPVLLSANDAGPTGTGHIADHSVWSVHRSFHGFRSVSCIHYCQGR